MMTSQLFVVCAACVILFTSVEGRTKNKDWDIPINQQNGYQIG